MTGRTLGIVALAAGCAERGSGLVESDGVGFLRGEDDGGTLGAIDAPCSPHTDAYPGTDGWPYRVQVPDGCTELLVVMWGSAGNTYPAGNHGDGGAGGYTAALLDVTPLETLWYRPGINEAQPQRGGQASVLSRGFDGYDFSDVLVVAGAGAAGGWAPYPIGRPGSGGAGGERGERGIGVLGDTEVYAGPGGPGTTTAGGAGGVSIDGTGGDGLSLNESTWWTGGLAWWRGGDGGQGWFSGGGGTGAASWWYPAGSGGGGGGGYVTPGARLGVIVPGRGIVPGNAGHPDRAGAADGPTAGRGDWGRIVLKWNTAPTGDDLPLTLTGREDNVAVGEEGQATAVGAALDYDWTVSGGEPVGDTHGPTVTFRATAAPGAWVDLALDATVPGRDGPYAVTLTRRVHTDFADTTAAPYDRLTAVLHANGVTGGCGGGNYCPLASTTRAEMAVFLLASLEGPDYTPPACSGTTRLFSDVPATDPYCRWIEELAVREVTSGCGNGLYCPGAAVTREQMAVFLLATREGPGYLPPEPTVPPFDDVPVTSAYARWIAEIARRGITSGCGTGMYCPTAPVKRQDMSAFLTTTFDLVYLP